MFDLLSIAIPFVVFLLFLLTVLFMFLAARRTRDNVSRTRRDEPVRKTQQEIPSGQARDDRTDSGFA